MEGTKSKTTSKNELWGQRERRKPWHRQRELLRETRGAELLRAKELKGAQGPGRKGTLVTGYGQVIQEAPQGKKTQKMPEALWVQTHSHTFKAPAVKLR